MAEITATLWKNGNSYAVRIPKALIDCKVLDPTRPITVTLTQDGKGGTGVICHGKPFLDRTFLDAAFSDPLDPLDTSAQAI